MKPSSKGLTVDSIAVLLSLDFSDTTLFVPPTYFKSLTRALKKVTPVPLFPEFPELDSLASLSLESDVRPATKRKGKAIILACASFLLHLHVPVSRVVVFFLWTIHVIFATF